ncbi:MAG: phosphatidate cytidylyltransferase [Alphaproteobacteria bacterium]
MNDATAPPVRGSGFGELPRRILSTAVLAPAALAAAYFGPPYFTVLILSGALVLAFEWGSLCGGARLAGPAWLLFPAVAGPVAIDALAPGAAVVAVAAIALGALVVLAAGRLVGARQPGWLAAGVLYIGLPALALLWLRAETDAGRAVVLWLFGVVWATDIGAYLAGRALGGPRFAPRISPKKTWAGVVGGIAAAALVSALAAWATGVPFGIVAAGAGLAVAAEAGDLMESAVKRHFGVKDMSHIIPGHGGLFDRVDGLLIAAPCAALALYLSEGTIFPWR